MRFVFLMLILSIYTNAEQLFLPVEKNVEVNKEIAILGEELFFDRMLSKDFSVSCFDCHAYYGADNKSLSIGSNNLKGKVNTPSLFNVKYNFLLTWNGRNHSLKKQLEGPLFEKHEMNMDIIDIEDRLRNSEKYIRLFKIAFNAKPNYENMLDAIVEFEKTLTTPNSKFDKFLRGEEELSKEESKGFELFKKYGCVSCHNGINIGANSFQKRGAVIEFKENHEDESDNRYAITKNKEDINVYRVPSLRNVEKTAPYFHTGVISDLTQAINLMAYHNLGKVLKKDEVTAIEFFLKTLTGELPESYKKRIKE